MMFISVRWLLMIQSFKGKTPQIDASVYVHETAIIIGDVIIKKDCSIWPYVVIRGDTEPIVIDEGTSIQEHVTIHAYKGYPVHIGKHVTVGHHALVHGATIEDEVLIGMDSVLLDGCLIKKHSLVGAKALVTSRSVFDERSLILGSPAKVVKRLDDQQVESILESAQEYIDLKNIYIKERYD